MPVISGEKVHFTCIRCADNDEWREQRTKGIGGSDVAAIMGFSPWRTPAQVWLEKTGRVQPEDISDRPYVEFGNIMEPLVGSWYSKMHPSSLVRRVNAVCQSIERPWAQASLDYEVRDPELGWGVLEIKTARSDQDWSDGVPLYYQTQVIHYMTVTGRKFADVAVFFRDTCEFAEYRVTYDEEDATRLAADVDNFWHVFVEGDVMPRIAGTEGEVRDLTTLFGMAKGDFRQLIDGKDARDADQAISDYQEAAQREKEAKAEKTKATATLIGIIGEDKGIETDVARVTWVRSSGERFDLKKFRADHPDLYDQYCTHYTKSGGVRIKELS